MPFTYETKRSGVGIEEPHSDVWYARTLAVKPHGGRVLLHFEGSDWHTRVFVNGRFAGEHRGGYARFRLTSPIWSAPAKTGLRCMFRTA